jgi:hypothetical protein
VKNITTVRSQYQSSYFILGGDFNLPDIDWESSTVKGHQLPRRVNEELNSVVLPMCTIEPTSERLQAMSTPPCGSLPLSRRKTSKSLGINSDEFISLVIEGFIGGIKVKLLHGKAVIISAAYRPPNRTDGEYIEQLVKDITTVR